MRSKDVMMYAFAVAVLALLAAPVAAQDSLPWSCEAIQGEFGFSVADGPTQVDCDNPADHSGLIYDAAGDCTAVAYDVDFANNNKPDHVGILARPPVYAAPGGDFSFALCYGDASVTGLGVNNCHEQAIKYNPSTSKSGSFLVVVEGKRVISTTTVSVRKGSSSGYCEIVGVGPEPVVPEGCVPSCGGFNPDQTLTKTEKLNFKGCEVVFEFDLNTGEVVDAYLTPESATAGCDFDSGSVAQLSLSIDGDDYGFGKFGDGIIATGTESCSCRVIGGRWWCWGKPCPQ